MRNYYLAMISVMSAGLIASLALRDPIFAIVRATPGFILGLF
ncbi:hypothetical protein [Micromonospora haikouensis]